MLDNSWLEKSAMLLSPLCKAAFIYTKDILRKRSRSQLA